MTVFEAAAHVGGHTHTHSIEAAGECYQVDTGFIVFNRRTYPRFCAMLEELGVASQPSAMSFSVRNEESGLEYNGSSLDGLFTQRRNLLRPSFLNMLREILRFSREAPSLLSLSEELSLKTYLDDKRYSRAFIDGYLVPMGAAIWSTDPARMLEFPACYFVRFLHNHGMLTVDQRPQWLAIRGGSARYVERLTAGFRDRIRLHTPVEWIRRLPDRVLVKARGADPEAFHHVFLACHSDQALRLLADPSPQEREVLGAIGYQENEAVLHIDTSLLPCARRAWAAWNYHALSGAAQVATRGVALTYNMNILQSLRARETYCVTLNAGARIDPAKVIKRLVYHHPLYTPAAVAAQGRHAEIDGRRRTWYCGAYWGFGFHEDGVASALEALRHFEEGAHAERDLPRVA